MKDLKKVFAGLAAVSMMIGATACGNNGSSGGENSNAGGADAPAEETTREVVTTTAATVEKNTETLSSEAQDAIDNTSDKLVDMELENKTIKWLAHYDPFNPSSSGNSESVSLSYFKTKYGGEVKWYQTTWDTRYADLSTFVLGGEGIDFFPCDTAALPKGVISGMFQPVDEYIDMNSELWQNVATGMDIYNFNGKHYEFVTGISAEQVVIYNQKTIDENGLEDPAELWESGDWNWDAFKRILLAYVDPDSDCYGLDGYWTEKALYLSAGVPGISSDNGTLKCNLMDSQLEAAMNYCYDLYNNGLVIDRSMFDWQEQPQFMGEGRELFYVIGSWAISAAPETWSTKIDPADVRIVPVPSPAGGPNYQAATLDGWCLCKGAANPQGVARFAECQILSTLDEEAIKINDQKCRDDYGWSDELIENNKKINELAKANPVVDLSTGISTDVASLTTDGGDQTGLRAAFHGYEWATTREEITAVIETLVQEADDQLKTMAE